MVLVIEGRLYMCRLLAEVSWCGEERRLRAAVAERAAAPHRASARRVHENTRAATRLVLLSSLHALKPAQSQSKLAGRRQQQASAQENRIRLPERAAPMDFTAAYRATALCYSPGSTFLASLSGGAGAQVVLVRAALSLAVVRTWSLPLRIASLS